MNVAELFTYYSTFPMHHPTKTKAWQLVKESTAFYYTNQKGDIKNKFVYHHDWTKKLQSFFPFSLCVVEHISTKEEVRQFEVLFSEENTFYSFGVGSKNNQKLYFSSNRYSNKLWNGEFYTETSLKVGKEFIRLLARDPAYRLYAVTGSLQLYESATSSIPCEWFQPLLEEKE